MTCLLTRLSDLVVEVDERNPPEGSEVFSVSERHGIVPQRELFTKQIATSNRSKYRRIHYGDVVFNPYLLWNGAVGVCFHREGGCVSPAYPVLRPRQGGTERFLHYFFRSPELRSAVDAIAAGSVTRRRTAPLIEILSLQFRLPEIETQRKTSSLLQALDDKIELSRRMNVTLEAMAHAMFAQWIESHQDELRARTVQDLIEKKILIIGDGYRAKNSEFATDGLPFVRAGNLKSDGLDIAGSEVLSATSVAAAGHKVGRTGDVAFTSKGTVGRITRVSLKTGAFVYSPQVCFWRSTSPEVLHPNLLYRWMGTSEFTRQLVAVSTQTDMAPYVSLQDQRRMVITLPPPSTQGELADELESIDDMIAANAEQSRTLANLRDTLLPKLISGDLSVTNLKN